jgi:hypothetical protein
MYTGRRPALIPSSVQLSIDDYARIKNRTGRSPFPPPDAAQPTHLHDDYRNKQPHAFALETEEVISWGRSARPVNEDINGGETQSFVSPKAHPTEVLWSSKHPTRDSLGQESENHWMENKRKPTTFFQNEERCFSVDVRHTSELESSDEEFWQVSSPGSASVTKESINPFNQVQ